MKENADECKAIHRVESNPSFTYEIGGCEPTITIHEETGGLWQIVP